VSPLVILFVADAGEDPRTVLALVGLLTGMCPQVHHQVALLAERTLTVRVWALKQLKPRMHRLKMEVQTIAPRELLHTTWIGTGYE
jgi:hypothetical protein